jgi:hypothetical protein
LSAILLRVAVDVLPMLLLIMLSAIMLSVVMLIVVAPEFHLQKCSLLHSENFTDRLLSQVSKFIAIFCLVDSLSGKGQFLPNIGSF